MDFADIEWNTDTEEWAGDPSSPSADTPWTILSRAALAAAHPSNQKDMLGQHIFPFVYSRLPGPARKVTGMMLELDNSLLLTALSSQETLLELARQANAAYGR
eukprot:11369996-Heterocapsa_arctica.AAC.1